MTWEAGNTKRERAAIERPSGGAGAKEWAYQIIENDQNGIRSKSSLPLVMAKAALAGRSVSPRAAA